MFFNLTLMLCIMREITEGWIYRIFRCNRCIGWFAYATLIWVSTLGAGSGCIYSKRELFISGNICFFFVAYLTWLTDWVTNLGDFTTGAITGSGRGVIIGETSVKSESSSISCTLGVFPDGILTVRIFASPAPISFTGITGSSSTALSSSLSNIFSAGGGGSCGVSSSVSGSKSLDS